MQSPTTIQKKSEEKYLTVKDILWSIFRSLSITSIISVILSIIGYFTLSMTILQMIFLFAFVFFLQVFVWILLQNHFQHKRDVALKELEKEELKLFLSQSKEVECPACNHKQYVPIFVEMEENKFKCSKCGEHSIINIEITVAKIC